MTLIISKFRCLLPCAIAVLMAACAPMTVPPQAEYPVGRARLVLPPGAWQDLGAADDAAGRAALQTRAVGLRDAQGGWVAVLRVQTNRTGDLQGAPQGASQCPLQRDVTVEDIAAGSPVRADCLRFKNWGSSAQWLEKNRPDLAQWLDSRQVALKQPYSYLSYRYVTDAGASVVVDALVDQRLLRPKTRNNEEFLVAGRPALQWGHDLAQAARLSVSMMDGYLAVPPFPFATP
nr:hypothetical protein [Acidovorax sp.]